MIQQLDHNQFNILEPEIFALAQKLDNDAIVRLLEKNKKYIWEDK